MTDPVKAKIPSGLYGALEVATVFDTDAYIDQVVGKQRMWLCIERKDIPAVIAGLARVLETTVDD